MKKQIILMIIMLVAVQLSYGQNWQWAKQIGGTNSDKGGVRIDAYNNIYCSGIFKSTCFFEYDTLHASGNNDIFFAKYDSLGHELWAKRIGGNNPIDTYEYGGVSIIDKKNDCLYFAGYFYDALTIGSHTISSSGGADIFLAKFDLYGNCIWIKKSGSYGDDSFRGLCLDDTGNLYFMGQLEHNGSFGTISLPAGTFLSKIDTSSTILWARNEIIGGTSNYMKISNNTLVLSGNSGSFTMTIDTMTLISTNQVDGFIARLDLNGNYINAKRFSGHFPVYAGDFDFDSNYNNYLSGQFTNTLTIDGTTLTANSNNGDMFFCKFDSAFNLIWIKQSYSTGNSGAEAHGVLRDNEGKFYLTGYFSGNAVFGSYNVTSSVTKDFFLARYSENGECIGILHFGEAEAGSIQTGSVNIDHNGDIIVGGNIYNTVNIGGTSLTSYGASDMFFAKTSAITGIMDYKTVKNNQLLIYANPTTGKCTVSVPDDFLNEKHLTLSIFDTGGKMIQQKTLEMNEGRIKVDLEEEAKGIYNVTLSNGKRVYGGRIVFQ